MVGYVYIYTYNCRVMAKRELNSSPNSIPLIIEDNKEILKIVAYRKDMFL